MRVSSPPAGNVQHANRDARCGKGHQLYRHLRGPGDDARDLYDMISRCRAFFAMVLVALIAGCSDSAPAKQGVLRGVWGSDQARLSINDSTAVLQVLGGSGCYGARADAGQPVQDNGFVVAVTYTQYTGAYPGYVQQPARMSGTLATDRLSVSVVAAGSGQLLAGPFDLTLGVNPQWNQCLYP